MTKDELRAEINDLQEVIAKLQSVIPRQCIHEWYRGDTTPNARFCIKCRTIEVRSDDGYWWRRSETPY